MTALEQRAGGASRERFAATRWTVVLQAREKNSPEVGAALETLCRVYWPPLYAFARRQGRTPHDAQDLTQAFFARLLEDWGSPVCWQGWVVMAIYVGLLVAGARWLTPEKPALVIYVIGLSVALIAVCWWKGEKPAWRWGGKKK